MTKVEKSDLRAQMASGIRALVDACREDEVLQCMKEARFLMSLVDTALGTTDKPGEDLFD